MKTSGALTTIVVFAALLHVSLPAASQTVVVRAARLIDGRGGPPLEPAVIRIVGERIEEVGTTIAVPASVDTQNRPLIDS